MLVNKPESTSVGHCHCGGSVGNPNGRYWGDYRLATVQMALTPPQLLDLPVEVIIKILENLDHRALLRVSQVCDLISR